jgi:hypothetical protein
MGPTAVSSSQTELAHQYFGSNYQLAVPTPPHLKGISAKIEMGILE